MKKAVRCAAIGALLGTIGLATGCGGGGGGSTSSNSSSSSSSGGTGSTGGTGAAAALPIDHVFIIFKENHTFDNYFATYPGANGQTWGLDSHGNQVPLHY